MSILDTAEQSIRLARELAPIAKSGYKLGKRVVASLRGKRKRGQASTRATNQVAPAARKMVRTQRSIPTAVVSTDTTKVTDQYTYGRAAPVTGMAPGLRVSGRMSYMRLHRVTGSAAQVFIDRNSATHDDLYLSPSEESAGSDPLSILLGQLAKVYGRYTYRSLRISYAPSGVSTTDTGSVILAFSTDPGNFLITGGFSYNDLMSVTNNTTISPWQTASIDLPLKSTGDLFYTNQVLTDTSATQDRQLFAGCFMARWSANQTATGPVGTFYLDYVIDLYDPTPTTGISPIASIVQAIKCQQLRKDRNERRRIRDLKYTNLKVNESKIFERLASEYLAESSRLAAADDLKRTDASTSLSLRSEDIDSKESKSTEDGCFMDDGPICNGTCRACSNMFTGGPGQTFCFSCLRALAVDLKRMDP